MGKNPAEKAKAAAAKVTDKKVESSRDSKKKKTTKKKVEAKVVSSEKKCKMTKCKREYKAKGYCKAHYKQWRQGKFGVARYKTCNDISGCRKPMAMNRHGYCEEHFQAYYVKGVEVPHAAPAEKPTEKTAAEKATA